MEQKIIFYYSNLSSDDEKIIVTCYHVALLAKRM